METSTRRRSEGSALRIRDEFFDLCHLREFIHNLSLDMYALADLHAGHQHAVLHYGAGLDDTVSADDGIFHRSAYHTAVCHKGLLHHSRIQVLRRAGVAGTGIDGPGSAEQVLRRLQIQKLHISVIIALEIAHAGKEAAQGDTADIQF